MVWKRILYEKQGYPDNYVDGEFFKQLQTTNIVHHNVSLVEAILATGQLSFEMSSVVGFAVVFISLQTNVISPGQLFFILTAVTSLGYFTYRSYKGKTRSILDDCGSVIIFLGLCTLSAPILRTLTQTISSDTLVACTVLMMLAHLVFHNYGADVAIVSPVISLNAAIFGCICLASRMPTVEHTLIILCIAAVLFGLCPMLRILLWAKCSNSFKWIVLCIYPSIVSFSVLWLSTYCFLLLCALFVFVNIICPYWYVKWQSIKDLKYGLWDEAIPDMESIEKTFPNAHTTANSVN